MLFEIVFRVFPYVFWNRNATLTFLWHLNRFLIVTVTVIYVLLHVTVTAFTLVKTNTEFVEQPPRVETLFKEKKTPEILSNNQKKNGSKLTRFFVHRKDVFAVQVKYGNKHIYVPKYQLLVQEDIEKHLEGNITLGVYTLGLDNTVKWICFDIDSQHIENTEEARDLIYERCVQKFGLDAVRVEASGSPHNFHVWVFFTHPIEARFARALGLKILESIEHVELFPKQTVLTGKRLGNLVKLPLGYHKKSGSWSTMNLEGIKPCKVDVTKIEAPAPKVFGERLRLEGYKGGDPNCILKIKKGVKKGERNNAGIIYASYLMNFKQLRPDHGYYLFRLWNTRNKPRLSDEELRAIFEQSIRGGYVFGCAHENIKDYCEKEGCVLA